MKWGNSPVTRGNSPVMRGNSPVMRGNSPVMRGNSPAPLAAVGKIRAQRGGADLLTGLLLTGLASLVILYALAFFLWFYRTRAGETEAALLCDTVSLLVQDDLTKKSFEAVQAAVDAGNYHSVGAADDGFGMAPELGGVTLPRPCYGGRDRMARRVKIEVLPDAQRRRCSVTVQAKNASGRVMADNAFTVVPLGRNTNDG